MVIRKSDGGTKGTKETKDVTGDAAFGGIFAGLAGLVEKLGELAEKGGELSRSGELQGDAKGKEFKGVYGFSVKVGVGKEGGNTFKVEPFGNVGKAGSSGSSEREREAGRSEVSEVREPLVDVYDEDDCVLVVAELPGVSKEELKVELADDILTLSAEKGERKYRKEVLLPAAVDKAKMTVNCHDGMAEIRIGK